MVTKKKEYRYIDRNYCLMQEKICIQHTFSRSYTIYILLYTLFIYAIIFK